MWECHVFVEPFVGTVQFSVGMRLLVTPIVGIFRFLSVCLGLVEPFVRFICLCVWLVT